MFEDSLKEVRQRECPNETTLINGDCLQELKNIKDKSVDLVLTDPPYGLEFMGKEWDKFKEGERK